MRKQKQQTLAPMPPAMATTANDKYLFQLLPISLFDANIFHGFFFTFHQNWFRTLSSLICLCIFNKRKIRRKIEEKFKIVLNSDSDFFPRTFY